MKNLNPFLLFAFATIIFTSCKKEAATPLEIEPTEITVTANCFADKSQRVAGGRYFFINIKTTYPIRSVNQLHCSFNNDYYSGNNKVSVTVQLPYATKDTTIETYQIARTAVLFPDNFKIDSISGVSKFKLKF